LSALLQEHRLTLSTQRASRREVLAVVAIAVVSFAFFLLAARFATKPLAKVPAFIPAYESALATCDLITAVLLFGQFNVSRSSAVFVLASGYLFTAFIAVSHALTFPAVFSITGLLGAGLQTTVWMYVFWHAGFPLFVIGYALLKARVDAVPSGQNFFSRVSVRIAISTGIVGSLALVCGLTVVATNYEEHLPNMIQDGLFLPAMHAIVSMSWCLSLAALATLAYRRPHTVMDLWMMVVMCAWLFEIAMSGVLSGSRFDLGWYAGRLYGLMSASFLLVLLLIESVRQYAWLSRLSSELIVTNESLEQLSMHDGLTELANRRCFDKYLTEQVAVARRHNRSLALVICDVDSFKTYNDQYGHQVGDECLKRIAVALRSCCRRPADMAARYGGEEFALILPDTELAGATLLAEAARDKVAGLGIPHPRSVVATYVSLSGGIAMLFDTVDHTAVELIRMADEGLYEAKHLGRNCVVSMRPGAQVQLSVKDN
jgi:diguanylate cyclase (GGDEF)-like protein